MRKKIKFNNKEEWLKLRSQYIGASEVAILSGNNKYQTLSDLYNRKVHGVETPVNERMLWGNILEDAIAREWAERNDRKVKRSNYLYVFEEILAATIDRFDDLQRVVEIKNMSGFAFNNSKLIEGVPAIYFDQIQSQLLCTNKNQAVFVALIDNGRLYDVNVEFDYDYAMALFNEAKKFYANHISIQVPPKETTKEVTEISQESFQGSQEDYQIYERIKTISEAIKQLNEEKTLLIEGIKNKIGNKKELIYSGEKLFYYTQYYQFNSSQFRKENPELYDSYKNQLIIKFNIGGEK